jgi:hypothetical protein
MSFGFAARKIRNYLIGSDLNPPDIAYAWIAAVSDQSDLALTDENRLATWSNYGSGNVRVARTGIALTGKVYVEFTYTLTDNNCYMNCGVTINAAPGTPLGFYTAGNYQRYARGFSAFSGCGFAGYAGVFLNAAESPAVAYNFTRLERVGVAVNMTNGKVWHRGAAGWVTGDPTADVGESYTIPLGPSYYFSAGSYSCLTGIVTTSARIYSAGSLQVFGAPAGFTPYQPNS